MKPDAWIMTGSKRGNSQVLPLGYAVKPEAVKAQAQTLLARPGVSQIPAVRKSGPMAFITTSITTRGILSAWNTWRKISTRRPSAISNPDETYHYIVRHFTDLPDQPFVFSWQQSE